jgi:hypothetical protein
MASKAKAVVPAVQKQFYRYVQSVDLVALQTVVPSSLRAQGSSFIVNQDCQFVGPTFGNDQTLSCQNNPQHRVTEPFFIG